MKRFKNNAQRKTQKPAGEYSATRYSDDIRRDYPEVFRETRAWRNRMDPETPNVYGMLDIL